MRITLKQYMHHPNAGDAASAIVVSHITGESLNVVGVERRSGPHLLAIGSILEWMDEQSVVWGSGYIRADTPLPAVPKAVLAVRGELTWAKLNSQGVACDPIFGDPGIFIPEIYPRGQVKWSVGLVPHYVDIDAPFVGRARAAGLHVINPLSPFDHYISALTGCERIISSSLHGLIFAHAYGIPAVWVKLSDHVVGNGFKFFDYYTSVGVRAHDVPSHSADDAFPSITESCHLPLGRIDKSALRDALLGQIAILRRRAPLRRRLKDVVERNRLKLSRLRSRFL